MTARCRAIAKEIQDQARTDAAIERGCALRAMAAAVDCLDAVGSEHLGHLRYGQALRFHRATEMLHDLMFELTGHR